MSPSPQRPLNTDSLVPVDAPTGIVLEQGQSRQFSFTYLVTSPRLSTTVTAQIQGADGWLVQISANGVLSDAGTAVNLTDSSAADAGNTITLALIVTAPSVVTADQSITLWFSSTSQDLDGLVVQGVAANGPLVSVGATPPPPTPTIKPSETPTVMPTAVSTAVPTMEPTVAPTESTIATPVTTTEVSTPTSEGHSATPVAGSSCAENGPASLPVVQSSRVGFGSSTFNGTSYPALADTITITVSLPESTSCLVPHWSVILSASNMANKDGSIVPTSAITYQGVTGLDAPDLTETAIQPSTSLDTPLTIVSGSDKTLDATHPSTTFGVLVNLSPSATTPPGDYSGTIVADSIAAP